MTETIADRYRRRAQTFTDTVAAVPADAWSQVSPCPEWTAIDVVRHVVDTQAMFAGFVQREPEPGPTVDDDPLGAWAAARKLTQQGLDAPQLAAEEFDGAMGRQRYDQAVDRFLTFDLAVHRWDLARAAGLDDQMPPADLDAMEAAVTEMDEKMSAKMRGPGAFGPEVAPPEDADRQTRLLAFLGRRAW